MDGYGEDLAYIHDVGFELVARNAIEVVVTELGEGGGLVVELGCGGGLVAEALIRRGFDYLGYDLSPAMVALARERVPGGSFEVASFLDLDPPPAKGILAIGEVLGYAIDSRNDHGSLEPLLGGLFRALEPGGRLIFDLAGPGRGGEEGVTRNFATGEDWAVMAEGREDAERALLHREITAFRLFDGCYRRSHESQRLLLHRPAEVRRLLLSLGAEVELRAGYGNERLPGHTVYIARKPA